MELQLVNVEQAKTLKELGFPTKWTYDKNIPNTFQLGDIIHGFAYHYCPTLELVAKWLREEKEIEVLPVFIIPYKVYEDRCRIFNKSGFTTTGKVFAIYEEALSAGIDKAIEILKRNNGNGRTGEED